MTQGAYLVGMQWIHDAFVHESTIPVGVVYRFSDGHSPRAVTDPEMSPSSVMTDTECPLHLPMEMQPDEVVLASTHASDEPGTEMSPPCALTRSPQYRSGMCATISALLDDSSLSWTSEYQKHITNMVNFGWFQRDVCLGGRVYAAARP